LVFSEKGNHAKKEKEERERERERRGIYLLYHDLVSTTKCIIWSL
jgi:hypothetical protein